MAEADLEELRLPEAPVKDIMHRAGVQLRPDAVATARFLAEEAIEQAARRAAEEVKEDGRKTIDGDHVATWWSA
jgi:histone H3/H4